MKEAQLAQAIDGLQKETYKLYEVSEQLRSVLIALEFRVVKLEKVSVGHKWQTFAPVNKDESQLLRDRIFLDHFKAKLPFYRELNSRLPIVEGLESVIHHLEGQFSILEKANVGPKSEISAPVKKVEDDDDMDLFGSDEEDEEADKAREERAQAALAKKKPKPGVVAKSSVVLDIKPWDDETDLIKLEEAVRSVQMDGLLWGKSQLLPVAFGVKKLQIVCVVEDEKVSIDELSEKIEAFEEYVQSVDVAAFQKI